MKEEAVVRNVGELKELLKHFKDETQLYISSGFWGDEEDGITVKLESGVLEMDANTLPNF